MLERILFTSFVFISLQSVSSWASSSIQILETCSIDQSLVLSAPTQVLCSSDLKIANGVSIEAGQNGLQIFAVGRIEFGHDFKIVSKADSTQIISIYGRTAFGFLQIESSTDVEMEFGSVSSDYQQDVKLEHGAEVRTIVAGQLLQLAGPEHRILR